MSVAPGPISLGADGRFRAIVVETGQGQVMVPMSRLATDWNSGSFPPQRSAGPLPLFGLSNVEAASHQAPHESRLLHSHCHRSLAS
jgi:hypothetical protein